eukprot:s8391_g1.t1
MFKDRSTGPAHSLGDVLGAGKGLLSQEQSQMLPPALLGPAGDVFVVINLMPSEVEVFAEYHQDFIATLEVVSAYRHSCGDGLFKVRFLKPDACIHIRQMQVWPRALYRQVVLLGNRLYLQLFLQHLPLSKEWLQAIVQLYLDEPCPEQFSSRMLRMKQFLREGVTNLEIRHQLARQLGLGFTDVAIETASLAFASAERSFLLSRLATDNLVPDRITVERGGNPNQDNQDILQGEVKAKIPDYLDDEPYCLHPPETNPMIRAQKTPTGRPPTTRGIPREVLSGDSVFSAGDFPQAVALSASQGLHPTFDVLEDSLAKASRTQTRDHQHLREPRKTMMMRWGMPPLSLKRKAKTMLLPLYLLDCHLPSRISRDNDCTNWG